MAEPNVPRVPDPTATQPVLGDPERANAEAAFLAAIQASDVERVAALLKDDPTLAHARAREGVVAGATAVLQAFYLVAFNPGRSPGPRQREVLNLVARAEPLDTIEASAVGDLGRLRILLAGNHKARANAVSGDGWTPLHLATEPAVLQVLLDAGADIHRRSSNAIANTALHGHAFAGHLDAVRFLLERGADPNVRCGWTALHHAADRGDRALVELLLKHGADATIADDHGRLPGDLARAHAHQAVAVLLPAAVSPRTETRQS
jgi:hypothetical protein